MTRPDLQSTVHPCRPSFKKVLFLDFDGVLHPEICDASRFFCFAANLARVLESVDSEGRLPVVVSSAWRLTTELDALRQLLGHTIARRVVGVTPDIYSAPADPSDPESPRAAASGARQREVEAWMGSHAKDGSWLAIDDQRGWFAPDCPNLFCTSRQGVSVGLDEAFATDLHKRLTSFLR